MKKIIIISIIITLALLIILVAYSPISCKIKENKIKTILEKNNFCQKDSDCAVVMLECPFGCYTYLNKNSNIQSIQKEVNKYQVSCTKCVYGCISPPSDEELKCIDNKCTNTNQI